MAIYIPFACLAAGSIVPTGLVVPWLLIGASFGRLFGLFSVLVVGSPTEDQDCDLLPEHEWASCSSGWHWVDPGAFAIYGAAAFFGGMTRLNLTIPVLFMEISGQTRLLLPIMITSKCGSCIADWLHPHSLFHSIIEIKGLTFLASEAPAHRTHELDHHLVQQIMRRDVAKLSSTNCTIGTAVAALEAAEIHNDLAFAIVDEKERFEGLISMVKLLMLMEATLDGTELEHQALVAGEVRRRLPHKLRTPGPCSPTPVAFTAL
jgi:chloride channel 7